jgi:hypothetical protein
MRLGVQDFGNECGWAQQLKVCFFNDFTLFRYRSHQGYSYLVFQDTFCRCLEFELQENNRRTPWTAAACKLKKWGSRTSILSMDMGYAYPKTPRIGADQDPAPPDSRHYPALLFQRPASTINFSSLRSIVRNVSVTSNLRVLHQEASYPSQNRPELKTSLKWLYFLRHK